MINYELRDYREDNLTIFDIAHIDEIMKEPVKYDWFAAHVLRLCRKASRANLARLSTIYPDIVAAYCFYKFGYIPDLIKSVMPNPDYYEYWIPRLMERVK